MPTKSTLREPRAQKQRLSDAERAALGKKARAEVPRSTYGVYEPASDRPDPIDLLEAQAQTRVPELVPIRYGRMLVSPFTFYRGAAKIMASDLAGSVTSGLRVQACGDAHLSNFGVFASPERRMVFDINDFDETLPGPWEWDVKRLVASMLIAARHDEFPVKDQEQIVLETAGEYRAAMRRFAAMKDLDVWYAHLEIEDLIERYGSQLKTKTVRRTEKGIAKARTRDSMQAFAKLTQTVDGRTEIVDQSPLIVPLRALVPEGEEERAYNELSKLLGAYRRTLQYDRRILVEQFEMADFARKVVGVGSVGTRAWIALFFGRDGTDPLFLQVKEAEASVLEQYVGESEFKNHGERVVTGQRLMQASSDIFLGWVRVPASPLDGLARDFYVRQLRDWKGSAEPERMVPEGMAVYGRLCGWTLARAHARSGDRIAIAAYLGAGTSFDRANVEFAKAYADQNERDFQRLTEAVESGRVKAETGL